MLLGLLAGFLASALGWQINLMVVQRGLQRGRFAAFLVGCGAVLGDMIFLTIGFTGTLPLLNHPEWWGVIRWVGIVVLLILAGRTFFVQGKPPRKVSEVTKRNPTKNFILGFLVVGTNPAVFLMWLGFVSLIRAHFSQTATPWFRERFLMGFLAGGLLWFVPFAFVFLKKLRKWTENNHSFISKISAITLVSVALFLIFFERF